jgi:hypothetical protein
VLYKVLANKTGPYGSLGRSLNMFISLVFDLTTTGLEAVVGAGGGIDIIGAFIPGMTGGNMIVFPWKSYGFITVFVYALDVFFYFVFYLLTLSFFLFYLDRSDDEDE